MSYLLTLTDVHANARGRTETLCLDYDPTVSRLTVAGRENMPVRHPAFDREGPVSWPVPHRVAPDNPGRKSGIRTLKIQMGFKCNYACAYCNQASWNTFLGGAVEDAKLFLRNLDTWFGTEQDRQDGGRNLRIEFWGGEPFVYWAKLKILSETLRRRYPKARFNIITNGSLLDDEKVDWLLNTAKIDAAFNYKKTDDFAGKLTEHCPKGIHLFFDNVGGSQLDGALLNMRKNGRAILCGTIEDYNEAPEKRHGISNMFKVVTLGLTVKGFVVLDYMAEYHQAFMDDMAQWRSEGKIVWQETVFEGIEQAPEAFLGLFSGANLGKMLVKLADD